MRSHRALAWAALIAAVVLVAAAGALAGILSANSQLEAGSHPVSLDAALQDAPWLQQQQGSATIATAASRSSLRFPAGVGYGEALTALYTSALETGSLPAGATLVAALPTATVLAGSPATGITVSLVAPFGYDETTGVIHLPSYNLPGGLSPAAVRDRIAAARTAGVALPDAAQLDVPVLPQCETLADPALEPTTCPTAAATP